MKQVLKDLLLNIIDSIDAGNSNITEEEAIKAVNVLKPFVDKKREVSKYEACHIVGLKRAQFDNYVRAGKIPRGHHQLGFKELRWYVKDLETFNNLKNEKI